MKVTKSIEQLTREIKELLQEQNVTEAQLKRAREELKKAKEQRSKEGRCEICGKDISDAYLLFRATPMIYKNKQWVRYCTSYREEYFKLCQDCADDVLDYIAEKIKAKEEKEN